MRKARRTSRRYRGARRGGIGVLIPVLAVLCIVAAGALYVINDNMAFTKDGTFFAAWGREAEPEEVDANLVIEDPAAENEAPEAEPQTEVPQTVAVPETSAEKRAYFVPIGTVKSAELFDAVLSEIDAGAAINTLVLEVKAEDGTLAFASDNELAVNAAVSGDDATLKSAMDKAKQKGYKVAVYMSCFKDNEVARKNQVYSARTANKIIWLDGENIRWLSAYSDSAQGYLVSCIEKLAEFAPDEIILSNISFPAVGKTEILAYDSSLGTKREMLQSFIVAANAAAGNIPLSAVYENYNENIISESGQKPEDFFEFDTVYASYAAGRYNQGFANAETLFDGAECKLIPITQDSSAPEFIMK